MDALPNELIVEILSRLPTPSIKAAAQVCTHWRSLTQQPADNSYSVWKARAKLYFPNWGLPSGTDYQWLCMGHDNLQATIPTDEQLCRVKNYNAHLFPLATHPNPTVSSCYSNEYVGEVKDGKFHGAGILRNGNGTFYSGEWKAGLEDGQGHYSWGTSGFHKGGYKKGMRHGLGHYIWENGNEYVGHYKRNIMWGTGVINFSGGIISGTWRMNKQHGPCTIDWKDGARFEGNYINGARTGYGELTWSDGAKFCGEFKEGLRHGYGVMTFANGFIWSGDYVSNSRHGKGTLSWPDGDVFEGNWDTGRRLGKGTLFLANGTTEVQYWNEDVSVKYLLGAQKHP